MSDQFSSVDLRKEENKQNRRRENRIRSKMMKRIHSFIYPWNNDR